MVGDHPRERRSAITRERQVPVGHGNWDRSESASGLCPGLHVRPRPDVTECEASDWLRELGVPAAPVVDDTRALRTEACRYLAGADEIVGIHHSSHDPPG